MQVDTWLTALGLKALGFNQLKVHPFQSFGSDVNLHPYTTEANVVHSPSGALGQCQPACLNAVQHMKVGMRNRLL